MIILKIGLVIAGSILFPIFGVASVLLVSANNGVTEELTTAGYAYLATSVFMSILGVIFIIVGVASKGGTSASAMPPSPEFICKTCGSGVSSNQKYCLQCGRQLLWAAPQYCCKTCGAEVSSNQRYCPQCGRQLSWS